MEDALCSMKKTNMPKKKIPHFESEAKEAQFWDENSIEDYMDEMEDVEPPKVRPSARTQAISLRISTQTLETVKQIASAQNWGYQSLIKKWIDDGLNKEQEANTIQLKEFVNSAQQSLKEISISLEEIKKRA